MRRVNMSLLKISVLLILLVRCNVPLITLSSQAFADQSTSSSQPQALATETAVAASTVAAIATESVFTAAVSRAYMNCLRDVDENSAELIANPKARDSEERYMRKFCDGRRESCIAHSDDAQCKLFLEDYAQ